MDSGRTTPQTTANPWVGPPGARRHPPGSAPWSIQALGSHACGRAVDGHLRGRLHRRCVGGWVPVSVPPRVGAPRMTAPPESICKSGSRALSPAAASLGNASPQGQAGPVPPSLPSALPRLPGPGLDAGPTAAPLGLGTKGKVSLGPAARLGAPDRRPWSGGAVPRPSMTLRYEGGLAAPSWPCCPPSIPPLLPGHSSTWDLVLTCSPHPPTPPPPQLALAPSLPRAGSSVGISVSLLNLLGRSARVVGMLQPRQAGGIPRRSSPGRETHKSGHFPGAGLSQVHCSGARRSVCSALGQPRKKTWQ